MPSPERTYTDGELCELLEKAEELGFSLEAGSELEGLTISELERLVKERE